MTDRLVGSLLVGISTFVLITAIWAFLTYFPKEVFGFFLIGLLVSVTVYVADAWWARRNNKS